MTIRADMWIAGVLVFVVALTVTACAADEGWKPLFNGKDLSGWKLVEGPAESWSVQDGLLHCNGKGHGWIATTEEYANFEVELDYRVAPGGNSGVYLRAPHEGNPTYTGMEIQILDDEHPRYADIKPWQHCGSLYEIVAAPPKSARPAEEWQTMHILCNGNTVEVTLNGKKLVAADLSAYPELVEKHPGLKRTTGSVGLQNHNTRVDFRNVRIRPL